MPSDALIIQTVQQIKDSVCRSEGCNWLGNLQTNSAKRHRAGRYIDGAVKIMDLLRDELFSQEINEYEALYENVCSFPREWADEQLRAARQLWSYVLELDQCLAHERILNTPTPTKTYMNKGLRTSQYNGLSKPLQPTKPAFNADERRLLPSASPAITYWSPTTWYTTSFVPAYYPGWALLHAPLGFDHSGSPLVWPGAS
ncbi:hypothetical protein BD309DRAFT_1077067 [Dichomitus squalens]|uniref:Uncharacterized protein n=1 Tax=Dichomitus squalens TaxID=114155 RepID=A0A4Q9P2T3_9APHY|nr:uncharacterized protein DICSQDRAFT_166272 [Dichomitus squalens LYAD-421 SS1]EJF65220.1 hypothetical protein DICSQDRAFT_166272 [Dichomitus squalens LYAD-421 SS1]TBU48639.1 hypothetical protein BD309DRAFT_1077067 [Dichomitus squalens]TBU59699.1 hypothetical protein BD310DRAFT_1038323 [Dichomitus squalens]